MDGVLVCNHGSLHEVSAPTHQYKTYLKNHAHSLQFEFVGSVGFITGQSCDFPSTVEWVNVWHTINNKNWYYNHIKQNTTKLCASFMGMQFIFLHKNKPYMFQIYSLNYTQAQTYSKCFQFVLSSLIYHWGFSLKFLRCQRPAPGGTHQHLLLSEWDCISI